MDIIESICIRYVGQNSTSEGSDVELTELQDTMDTSWITIRSTILSLCDKGTFKKLGKKSKILTLTAKGWERYNRLTFVETPEMIEEVIEVTEDAKPNLKRTNIIIDNVYHIWEDCRVGQLLEAETLTFAGNDNCKLSPAQEKKFRKYKYKFTNWDTFPRK